MVSKTHAIQYARGQVGQHNQSRYVMIERTNALTQFFLAIIEIEGICQLGERSRYCSHVVSEETTTQRSRDSQLDDKPRRKLQRDSLRLLPTTADAMCGIVVVNVIRIMNSIICRIRCICTGRHCGPSSFLDTVIVATFQSNLLNNKRQLILRCIKYYSVREI